MMGLGRIDLIIVAVYLAGITAFGLRFRKADRSLKNYFLADRNIPWWAIALSIVSAETSTLTIISIPGLAYDTNFAFLQLVLGYMVARVIISLIFIPQYFRGELFTAYQLIDRRFGKKLYRFTAGLFLATRAAAEGVRVFAISIVISIALQRYLLEFISPASSDIASIGIITLLTVIYTFEGGMTAVIWTDVVQMMIYVAGTIVGFFTLLHLVPGGLGTVLSTAGAAHKFQIFDFTPTLFKTYTFWAGLIGGTFLTTASHGTDQLMVQRLLAARDQKQSIIALLASGGAVLFQFSLFLMVGAGLFVFYKIYPPAVPFLRSDRIFPTFIVSRMPVGIAGLLIAAILAAAMSNLSAALNSLSSTTVMDFYLKLRPQASESRRMTVSRFTTVFWAAVLFALAILTRSGGQRVLEIGLQIASIPYGGLLGVFLLGVLTRKANENGALLGMMAGLAINAYLWLGTKVAWTWYVTIGAITTFVVGYVASRLLQKSPPEPSGNGAQPSLGAA